MKEDVENWSRGPRAQALIGSNARHQIELGIVADILSGRIDFTNMQMEYWTTIHDQAAAIMAELKQLRGQTRKDDGT